jgi:hypothetical protein
VSCGGYKKDFKWRPFGEGSFGLKLGVNKSRTGIITLGRLNVHPQLMMISSVDTSENANLSEV